MMYKDRGRDAKNAYRFMNVYYHNKGIGLSKILNSKCIRETIPTFVSHCKPPLISYTYTEAISGKAFNQKKAVDTLDFDVGTEDVHCDCSTNM